MAAVGGAARRTRLVSATALVGLGSLGTASSIGASPVAAPVIAMLLAGSVVAWWRLGRTWAVRGVVAWSLLVSNLVSMLGWLAHLIIGTSATAAALVLGSSTSLALLVAAVRVGGYAMGLVA